MFHKAKRFPYSALIELTPKCNMNCVHCYLQKHHQEYEMSYEQIIEILNVLHNKGILFVTFTGGEIFTRKDFLDIYLYAKRKGFIIELFTNGTILTKSAIEVLEKFPPVLVDVSMYGACEETYQKVTGCSGMFDKVVAHCKDLVAHEIRVALRTPVLTYTLRELDAMKKIAKEIGAVFCTSFEISPTIEKDRISQQYQVKITEALKYEAKEFFERNQKTIDSIPESYLTRAKSIPIFSCKMGKGALVIDYQGNMFPCMKFRQIGKKLTKENFDGLWKSYKKYYLLKTKKDNPCNNCDKRYYCEVCPAEMDFLYGNMEYRTDVMCKIANFRKNLYEGKLSLEQAIEDLTQWEREGR